MGSVTSILSVTTLSLYKGSWTYIPGHESEPSPSTKDTRFVSGLVQVPILRVVSSDFFKIATTNF